MQSCRQIYNEAGFDPNDLCSTKSFFFYEARALVSWVKILSPAQKRTVADISLNVSNEDFNDLGIASALEELSGLRRLHILFRSQPPSSTTELQAYCIYQHVRSVQVSEDFNVNLAEGSTEEHEKYDRDWRNQEDFARAVQAKVLTPYSPLQHWVPFTGGRRGIFVLDC